MTALSIASRLRPTARQRSRTNALAESPEGVVRAVVGVHQSRCLRPAALAMPRGEFTMAAVGRRSSDRPTTRAVPRIKDDAAVELAFSGWVHGDVGHPQLVLPGPPERAVDQVPRGFRCSAASLAHVSSAAR
jgi:hypothetical protein